MLADTAFEDVNQEFTIKRETLGSGHNWKQHRSANNNYQLSDFLESDGRPKIPLIQPVAVFLIGIIFTIGLLMSSTSEFLNSQSEIRIALWSVPQATAIFSGLLLAFTVALTTLIYSLQRKVGKEWDNSERWKYVAPGWGFCHFTFGKSGIGVDGNHFLFFLEWEEVKYIRKTKEKLELQNQEGQILALPTRFFTPGEGGDISWDEAVEFIRKAVPNAKWF